MMNWAGKLYDRRLMKRILQIYKITSGKTPAYLKDELPPTRQIIEAWPTHICFLEKKSLKKKENFESERHCQQR